MNLGLIALLVLLPLLQIPAVFYLARFFEVEGEPPRMREFRAHGPGTTVPEGVCRHCGTSNDPRYTYCRRCVARLPS